jgi:hypothetical protein
MFSVHAGEFLVGNEIERRFPDADLWLPAKDTGVDLLLTNASKSRSVTLQVKYSRDFSQPSQRPHCVWLVYLEAYKDSEKFR